MFFRSGADRPLLTLNRLDCHRLQIIPAPAIFMQIRHLISFYEEPLSLSLSLWKCAYNALSH